jgi:hypothetical protein
MKKPLRKTTRVLVLLLLAISIPASFAFAQDTKLRKKESTLLILEYPNYDRSEFIPKLMFTLKTQYFNVVAKPDVVDVVKKEDEEKEKEKGKADISEKISMLDTLDLKVEMKEYKSVYILKMKYYIKDPGVRYFRMKHFHGQLIDNATGEKIRDIKIRNSKRRDENYGTRDHRDIINHIKYKLNLDFVTN